MSKHIPVVGSSALSLLASVYSEEVSEELLSFESDENRHVGYKLLIILPNKLQMANRCCSKMDVASEKGLAWRRKVEEKLKGSTKTQ